jgi:hypothetical protein
MERRLSGNIPTTMNIPWENPTNVDLARDGHQLLKET